MAIKHPLLSDWWKAEFNVFDGTIEFRGNGGDQATVTVNSGQKFHSILTRVQVK
jgi:hypothetical protein